MMFAAEAMTSGRMHRAGPLWPMLAVAAALLLASSWMRPAAAASDPAPAAAVDEKAGDDAALASFGLPPIVVMLKQRDESKGKESKGKTVILKVDLLFDERDEDRINIMLSTAKALLPRIMDSLLTGIQGRQFDDTDDTVAINAVLVERSNRVLRPYGVNVKASRLVQLGVR